MAHPDARERVGTSLLCPAVHLGVSPPVFLSLFIHRKRSPWIAESSYSRLTLMFKIVYVRWCIGCCIGGQILVRNGRSTRGRQTIHRTAPLKERPSSQELVTDHHCSHAPSQGGPIYPSHTGWCYICWTLHVLPIRDLDINQLISNSRYYGWISWPRHFPHNIPLRQALHSTDLEFFPARPFTFYRGVTSVVPVYAVDIGALDQSTSTRFSTSTIKFIASARGLDTPRMRLGD